MILVMMERGLPAASQKMKTQNIKREVKVSMHCAQKEEKGLIMFPLRKLLFPFC